MPTICNLLHQLLPEATEEYYVAWVPILRCFPNRRSLRYYGTN